MLLRTKHSLFCFGFWKRKKNVSTRYTIVRLVVWKTTRHRQPWQRACSNVAPSMGEYRVSKCVRSLALFFAGAYSIFQYREGVRKSLTYRPAVLRSSFFGNQSSLSSNHCQYCHRLRPHNTDGIVAIQSSCCRHWHCYCRLPMYQKYVYPLPMYRRRPVSSMVT